MEVLALALRAFCGASCSKWEFPVMFAGRTMELSSFTHFYYTSFDAKWPSFDQHLSKLLSSIFQDAAKGGAGDTHFFAGLLVVLPLQVCEANRFELIEAKSNKVF
jgi:hypothetical protein